jgi:hypothetical protein
MRGHADDALRRQRRRAIRVVVGAAVRADIVMIVAALLTERSSRQSKAARQIQRRSCANVEQNRRALPGR